VPPTVIATPGTLYPGDAFRITVRRQDLGPAAVIEGREGTVTVRALVLATGDVRSVEVTGSSGSGVLDRAAAQTVRAWRFAPATRDGAPIDAYVTLRLRYVVR
jgi:TonB family protein